MKISTSPDTVDRLRASDISYTDYEASYVQQSQIEFMDSDPQIVRTALIELYLNVKIRSADEVSAFTISERKRLI